MISISTHWKRGISLLLLFAGAPLRAAELKLAGLFTDDMVIQREQPVSVWGSATPGEAVSVTFGDQRKTTTTSTDGTWRIRLDPMPASHQPRELIVSSHPEQTLKRAGILVGDVWLCSGQSNMHFQMKSVANAKGELAAANQPALRFITVEHQFGQKAVTDVQGTWKVVSPGTAADCSAVACYFGMALQSKIGVPTGLVISSVGGTRIETWMRPETLASTGEGADLIEKWKHISPEQFAAIGSTYREFQRQRDEVYPQTVKAAKAKGEPPPPPPVAPKLRCHDSPSALHNGMIAPLEPFAFRGAVWYQGEANAGRGKAYEKLLPAMIADWRKVWGKDLPFLFVQIAPHKSIHPGFRESQALIWRTTPRTAMVVTTDVGNAENIHPTFKRPVGERLAIAARALVYGEQIEASGPVFKSMRIEGNRAVISFDHTGGGLVAKDGPLKGFTIAGDDGKYVPAEATIEGETIVVTSAKISAPRSVRYGWAQVPDVNLFNQAGFPAVPFTAAP